MLGGRHRRPRRQPLVLELEALDAAQEVALDDGAVRVELGALDGKAKQAILFGLLPGREIPRERDDVQSADGADGEDRTGLEMTHGWPPCSRPVSHNSPVRARDPSSKAKVRP
jgi:hypothetical protein